MSAERFSTGQSFRWQNEIYAVRRLLPDNRLTVLHVRSGEMQTVPLRELVGALFAGTLQFVQDGVAAAHAHKHTAIDWSDYPDVLRAVAEYRLEVIRPFLVLPPHARKKAITARVQEVKAPGATNEPSLGTALSVSSIYRWIADHTASGGDLRALIPNTKKRGGKQIPRLQAEVETIIQAVLDDLYVVREQRTIDAIHREIAVRIAEENQYRPNEDHLEFPSRATVDRRIAALDIEDKLTAKRGRRAAKQELTQYCATEYPTIPLARVEIDHTRTDIVVVDENDCLPLGRLTLTYCLDTATRYPLGYYLGFEPPSYYTVMECLYCTIWPKPDVQAAYGTTHDWLAYGIPYLLVIDNGKEFVGSDLQDACQLLGILLQRTPVQSPHFKAAVERMFGTLNTGLLHTLPGTTFANPRQRGDYDSLKQACISLGDLDKMLHIFLVDIYAEDYHRGLEGVPARRWEEATQNGFFPRVPASAEELRILLGRAAYRTIQPYGIEFESLRYNTPDLAPLRTRMQRQDDRRVKVKYHPSDLSRIWVYDPADQCYLEVPALAQTYTQGLSLWKHRVIRNFVLNQQDRVDIVALGHAQRRIQEIVEASLQRKKLGTRSRIARWQTSGPVLSHAEGAHLAGTALVVGEETDPSALPPLDLDLCKEDVTGEIWGVSYDLPLAGKGEP